MWMLQLLQDRNLENNTEISLQSWSFLYCSHLFNAALEISLYSCFDLLRSYEFLAFCSCCHDDVEAHIVLEGGYQ